MNRRYPVVFNERTPGSDFSDQAAIVGADVATGAEVRDLTLEERDALQLQINQQAYRVYCNYTPSLAEVMAGTHTMTFMELDYKVLTVDRQAFGNREIVFTVGRNA